MMLSLYEIDDLHQAVHERIEDELLPALTKANRAGELETLLTLLGMPDLLGDNGMPDLSPRRIAVLGDSKVKEGKLRSIAKKQGFNPSDFDFCLTYDEFKHYDFGKFRNSETYRAVFVGPMPHKTSGSRGASSVIAEMQAHQEIYPPTIRICEPSGELKITNNSFAKALETFSAMVA